MYVDGLAGPNDGVTCIIHEYGVCRVFRFSRRFRVCISVKVQTSMEDSCGTDAALEHEALEALAGHRER